MGGSTLAIESSRILFAFATSGFQVSLIVMTLFVVDLQGRIVGGRQSFLISTGRAEFDKGLILNR